MAELEIPDAATHWLAEAISAGFPPDAPEYRHAVRRIAAPVVAAELRRLAAEYENGRRTARCVLDLLNRANELEAK